MGADDLTTRVRRIYAAVAACRETDQAKIPARQVVAGRTVGWLVDFRGGMSEEELLNAAHQVIHNIASFGDHLRRWAANNGQDKAKVDRMIAATLPLRVIHDLWNNDKHGYPPRDGGRSGLAPKLEGVHRVMQLSTAAKPGSEVAVAMVMDRAGRPRLVGDGSEAVVVTGVITDKNGKVIGDLYRLEQEAVMAWEVLLREYGVGLPSQLTAA